MELEKRYVTYGALRLTGGMAVSGLGVIAFIWAVWTLVSDLLTGEFNKFNITDYLVIILTFVVFGSIIWAGRYMDKKQRWPIFTVELDEEGWIKYIEKEGDNVTMHYSIPPNNIVAVKYKKKYYPKKNKWYVNYVVGFTTRKDKRKIYGFFFYGWILEPKDIKEFDKLAQHLKNLAENNVKAYDIKVPSTTVWYPIDDWDKLEYVKRVNEEHLQKMVSADESGD